MREYQATMQSNLKHYLGDVQLMQFCGHEVEVQDPSDQPTTTIPDVDSTFQTEMISVDRAREINQAIILCRKYKVKIINLAFLGSRHKQNGWKVPQFAIFNVYSNTMTLHLVSQFGLNVMAARPLINISESEIYMHHLIRPYYKDLHSEQPWFKRISLIGTKSWRIDVAFSFIIPQIIKRNIKAKSESFKLYFICKVPKWGISPIDHYVEYEVSLITPTSEILVVGIHTETKIAFLMDRFQPLQTTQPEPIDKGRKIDI